MIQDLRLPIDLKNTYSTIGDQNTLREKGSTELDMYPISVYVRYFLKSMGIVDMNRPRGNP